VSCAGTAAELKRIDDAVVTNVAGRATKVQSPEPLRPTNRFGYLMAERKGRLLAMERVNEVIKRVLADPMVSDPISAALNELLPLAESLDAKTKNRSPEDPESNVARNLQGDIRSLEQMQQSKNYMTDTESGGDTFSFRRSRSRC